MKLRINIKKSHLIILAFAFFMLLGSILVYTFNTNQPSVLGHTAGEISWNGKTNANLSTSDNLCINGDCKNDFFNITAVCTNCGYSAWWGNNKPSSLSYPSCDTDNGWQPMFSSIKISGTKGCSGKTCINTFSTDATSCCTVCYKYE